MDQKLAYNCKEAGETLGCSERHISDMVRKGQIRVVRTVAEHLIWADAPAGAKRNRPAAHAGRSSEQEAGGGSITGQPSQE